MLPQSSANGPYFSKDNTAVVKGIAILLMVYHHLFVLPERLNNNYIPVLIINGVNIETAIALFAKICVALYLFLSGLGLYCSLIKEASILAMYRKGLGKLLRFMINYWIIAFIAYFIGLYNGFFQKDLITIIGIIIGYTTKIGEWWFVCQYVMLMLIAPLLVGIFSKRSRVRYISIILLVFTFSGYYLWSYHPTENALGSIIFGYNSYLVNWPCVSVFAIGILCSHYNIYKYFVYKSKRFTLIFNLLILLLVLFIRVSFIHEPASMELDFFLAPLFAYSFATIVSYTKLPQHLLKIAAKHSTNIWLTHTFWCYYYAQDLVLLPRFSILIYLWLLFLSFCSSSIINFLLEHIIKLLENFSFQNLKINNSH